MDVVLACRVWSWHKALEVTDTGAWRGIPFCCHSYSAADSSWRTPLRDTSNVLGPLALLQ